MTNVTRYPLIDDFDTTLAQAWDGATGTVYLNDVPGFTFPSGTTSCIVVNPGKSNMQVAEINALDSSAGTITVSDISINKGASVAYSQQSHAVGSVVRISNNYQFWSDLVTAINSKLDNDGDMSWDAATDFAGIVAKSLTTAQRTALTASNGMLVYDTDIGELYQYIGGSWSAVSSGSTQPNASTTVAGKVELATAAERAAGTATGGTGATLVPTNDALVKTSSGASDENKIPVLNSDGYVVAFVPSASVTVEGLVEMATDAEATAGTDETRYINPKQAKDNYDNTASAITGTITSAGTGTTIAHGLGATPRFITAIAQTGELGNETSTGHWISGTQACVKIQGGGQSRVTNKIIDTDDHTMEITAVDSTNITVTTTEPGAGTTSYTMWFLT